jgi:hypothetical protein
MPQEVLFFGRISVYAIVTGTIYWFVSYEAAGTVLLLGFGVATGLGFAALRNGARSVAGRPADPRQPDGPFGDESAPVPTRSAAPLAIGFGLAVVVLAGAFGPWFLIAGAVPLLMGSVDWLRAANRELELRAHRPRERR